LQDEQNFSKLMVVQEELKTMPFEDVWNEYCARCEKPLDGQWYDEVERYEREVLSKRS
ncbi:MAG: L-rhamnose isomerase, partial [Erysipelotrichaceae bacterium]|nr:L-rhamnose isomerase [Erysipelotrichaceae bacterium]